MKQLYNDNRRRRRYELKIKGLCQDCGKPALPGLVSCEYHSKIRQDAAKKWRVKNNEQGLCRNCGSELYNICHASKTTCVVCAGKAETARLIRGRID